MNPPELPAQSNTPTYKVVPFSATLTSTQDASAVASNLENLISQYTSMGWDYVGVHQVQSFRAGSNGCFGIGGSQPTTITTEFVVFRQ